MYKLYLFLSMRFILFISLLLIGKAGIAQTYEQVKKRFDKYLNYKGGLDKYVDISPEQITLYEYKTGKKETELVLSKNEWSSFVTLCKKLSPDSMQKIYEKKKAKGSSYRIEHGAPDKMLCSIPGKPLCEKKIMIDPGHMAGTMQMARIEQKYLHFSQQNCPNLKLDSLDIAEGILTFQTASILKKMLEEKGVTVALTRKENATSFGCTYEEWIKNHKKRTLDSLLKIKKIVAQKHKWLMKMNKGKFFVEFFKDFELLQRSRVINTFKPDLTVIIHYNVDEKNVPWEKPSNKDLCMAFIPGCVLNDNLETTAGKINFLRLLLSDDVDKSEKVSGLLVEELSKNLDVPIAKSSDATYLNEHCTATSSAGVFCRNLALCRLVQSPLMYGECLYQDHETECYELLKNTENKYGVQTNKRVVLAAESFYNAIIRNFTP